MDLMALMASAPTNISILVGHDLRLPRLYQARHRQLAPQHRLPKDIDGHDGHAMFDGQPHETSRRRRNVARNKLKVSLQPATQSFWLVPQFHSALVCMSHHPLLRPAPLRDLSRSFSWLLSVRTISATPPGKRPMESPPFNAFRIEEGSLENPATKWLKRPEGLQPAAQNFGK